MVKVLLMSGYGINCEKESAHAFKLAGAKTEIVHINDLISGEKKLSDYELIMFPGGFSYGDDTGSGNAFANKLKNNLWDDLIKFIDSGKLILGICNGFQIMTHLGLFSLPEGNYGERINAIEPNNSNRLVCRWVNLKYNKTNCVFTKGIDMTSLPVAHGEGRFFCDEKTFDSLKRNNQIVSIYCNEAGESADGKYPFNPNGAMGDVAGICDKTGRIMGMMPHPERAIYSLSKPSYHLEKELFKRKGDSISEYIESNLKVFKNAVDYFKGYPSSVELKNINLFKEDKLKYNMEGGIVDSNKFKVVIMAGSDSDKEHIEKVADSLLKYNLSYEVRICSAHKQADKLIEIIKEYNKLDKFLVYVAIAGGTDALSGTLSYHALGPVISCPPDAPNQSCLTNPPGSSNAYIVRPGNVGKFITQIFACFNPEIKERLESENLKKIKSLEKADKEFSSGNLDKSKLLTSKEAEELVRKYMTQGDEILSTQEILDSGDIPRLKGYKVRPGKVSDSIFGGKFSYLDKKIGQVLEFENPPLNSKDGIPLRIMVRTQRISTHDISRGEIPFKDQILAVNHNFMRRMLTPIIGTSQFEISGLEDTSVVIAAENLKQIPYENVLRAYMAKSSTSTSLYQHYINGKRVFCGHKLPEGLITNGPLPYVMDTPSTKSEETDESISPIQVLEKGICTFEQYTQIRNASLFAFGMVTQFLRDKGLIAVDTKTEHGINSKGEIVSQDEIWTMDSSRFWLLGDYEEQLEKLKKGEIQELSPKSYSKEFARGFSKGEEGYSEEERIQIAVRYIEGIQHILGKRFEPDLRPYKDRVVSGINTILKELVD